MAGDYNNCYFGLYTVAGTTFVEIDARHPLGRATSALVIEKSIRKDVVLETVVELLSTNTLRILEKTFGTVSLG